MIIAPSTRALIETYLRVATGPRHVTRICAFMETMYRIPPGTTRAMLSRLAARGIVEHCENHCYQGVSTMQKTITIVIDEFSDAVARLAEHAPPEYVAQLHRATADLLECFGTAAQVQASQYAMLLRGKVEAMQVSHDALQVEQAADHALIEALDARTERRATPRGEESGQQHETAT